MNAFEGGVISALPLGGIIGGLLCKSYGLLPVIGGVIAGIIAGSFGGWLYGLLILFMMSAFIAIWRGVRGLPELTEDAMGKIIDGKKSLVRTPTRGAFFGIIYGGLAGFTFKWWHGLLVALLIAIVTAFVAVAQTQLAIRKSRRSLLK